MEPASLGPPPPTELLFEVLWIPPVVICTPLTEESSSVSDHPLIPPDVLPPALPTPAALAVGAVVPVAVAGGAVSIGSMPPACSTRS